MSGLLGTSSGGNAVIAPIMLPIMGTLGVTPTVVTALFKAAGEIGLILRPYHWGYLNDAGSDWPLLWYLYASGRHSLCCRLVNWHMGWLYPRSKADRGL